MAKQKKIWIVMLYQANKPDNVIQVSSHSTKKEAVTTMKAMISKNWCQSVVENSYGFNQVNIVVVEAHEAMYGWSQ